MSTEKTRIEEEVEVSAHGVTKAEIVFVELLGSATVTRYKRPARPSPRVRCTICSRFRFEVDTCRCRTVARPYQPEVDGSLGGVIERRIGGPRKVSGMAVEKERTFKVRLGGDITAYPTQPRLNDDGEPVDGE